MIQEKDYSHLYAQGGGVESQEKRKPKDYSHLYNTPEAQLERVRSSRPRLTAGDVEWLSAERLPIIGVGVQIAEAQDMLDLVKLSQVKPLLPGDRARLDAYFDRMQRDSTWGYKVLDLVGDIPAFMAEYAMSGGAVSGAKKALGKAVKETMGSRLASGMARASLDRGKKTVMRKALEYGGDTAARVLAMEAMGGVAGALPGVSPGGRATLSTYQKILEDIPLAVDQEGYIHAVLDQQIELPDFWEKMPTGLQDALFEVAGEKLGGALAGSTAWSRVRAYQIKALEKVAGKEAGASLARGLDKLAKGGWHGPLEEMLEERASGAARATSGALGLGDFGGLEEFFPGWEQLSVELAAFSVPGLGAAATARALERPSERAARKGQEPSAPKGDPIPTLGDEEAQERVQRVLERDERVVDAKPIEDVEDESWKGSTTRQLVDDSYARRGVRNVWVDDEGEWRALHAGPGVVVTNRQGIKNDRAAIDVVVHEPVHDMRSRDPEAYQSVLDGIRSADPEGLEAAKQAYAESYGAESWAKLTEEQQEEEGVAFYHEEVAPYLLHLTTAQGKQQFERLLEQDRSLVQRVVDMLADVALRLSGKGSLQERRLRKLSERLGGERQEMLTAEKAKLVLEMHQAAMSFGERVEGLVGKVEVKPKARPTPKPKPKATRDARAERKRRRQARKDTEAALESARAELDADKPRTVRSVLLERGGLNLALSDHAQREDVWDRVKDAPRAARGMGRNNWLKGPKSKSKSGMSLEHAMEYLREQGFTIADDTTGSGRAEVTIDEIVEWVESEAGGEAVIHPESMAARRELENRIAELEQELAHLKNAPAVPDDYDRQAEREAAADIPDPTDAPPTKDDGDEGVPFSVPAYHGSGAEFDKFSLDKIGTGEGAQAYGWGLYFAGKKGVAEWYKEQARGKPRDVLIVDGREIGQVGELFPPLADEPAIARVKALTALRNAAGVSSDDVVGRALRGLEAQRALPVNAGKSQQGVFTYAQARIMSMRGRKVEARRIEPPPGKGYEVTLAPEEDEFLLWNKPLEDQPAAVRKALESSNWYEYALEQLDRGAQNPTGKSLYRWLEVDRSAKESSLELLALGIRGIKYLDGTSRGRGEGSYNYVIFDADDVEITGRFSPGRDRSGSSYNLEQALTPAPRVGSAAFKRWFGDSKVVDENGEPLVVYHGTQPSADYELHTFDTDEAPTDLIFFSESPEFADHYARWMDGYGEGGRVLPVYVAAENPWDHENPEHARALLEWVDQNEFHDDLLVHAIYRSVDTGEFGALEHPDVQAALRGMGHDGVWVTENHTRNVAVWDPAQIKSATGNRGTFDPNDPDIRHSVPAYHGSGAEFDKFSLDKIGTGNGAGMFGHGLYFSGSLDGALPFKGEKGFGYYVTLNVEEEDLLPWNGDVYREAPRVWRRLNKLRPGQLAGYENPEAVARSEFEKDYKDLDPEEKWTVDGYFDGTTGERWYQILAEELGSKEAASKALADAGVPGILAQHHGERGDIYVIFDADDVEITGRFSPGRDRSRSTYDLIEAFAAPEPGWFDNLKTKFTDKQRRAEFILEDLRERGVEIEDDADVVLAARLWKGLAQDKVNTLERFKRKFKAHLRRHGIELDDLDLALKAQHHDEAIAVLAQREGAIASIGINQKDLAKGKALLEKPEIMEAVTMIQTLNNQTLARRLEYGLIDQDTFDAWNEQFEWYIPLRSEDNEQGYLRPRSKGFHTTGEESQRRMGRRSESGSPTIFSFEAAHNVILRGEKNRVGQAFYNLVHDHGALGATALTPDEKLYEDSQKWDEEEFRTKIKGKSYTITIRDPHLAKSMKNLGVQEAGPFLNALRWINRHLARVLTQWNPVFWPTNLLRDFQAAMVNVAEIDKPKVGRSVMRNLLPAIRESYIFARDGHEAEGAKWAKRASAAGMHTGWAQVTDFQETSQEFASDLTEGRFKAGFKGLFDYIDRFNGAFEQSTRLAVFRAMVEQGGMSDAHAARYAREVTVDFNRAGEWTQTANALYLFFNATVQGNARALQAMLRSRRVMVRRVIPMVVLSAMMDQVLRALSPEDDDGRKVYDNIPEWEKENHMFFLTPGMDGYFKVPLPYGYNVIWNIGRLLSSSGSGKVDPMEASLRLALVTRDAFSPLQGGSALQAVMPTATRPFIEIAENKNFAGLPVRPEKYPGDIGPDAYRTWPSTPKGFAWAAQKLNDWTGGDEVTPGAIDINPESIDHLWEWASGGLGKIITRTDRALTSWSRGVPVESNTIPLYRRFVGDPTPHTTRTTYHDLRDAIDRKEKLIKLHTERGDRDLAARVKRENRDLLRLSKRMDATEKRIKALRDKRKASDDPKEQHALREREHLERAKFVRYADRRLLKDR